MADARPESQFTYQDYLDADAFGVARRHVFYWLGAKIAGVEFPDLLEMDETELDSLFPQVNIISTIAPDGLDDATPEYFTQGGVDYCRVALLYKAPSPSITFRRGTVRDSMECEVLLGTAENELRLMARLSDWTTEDLARLSVYDWNATRAARRNFTPRHTASPLSTD